VLPFKTCGRFWCLNCRFDCKVLAAGFIESYDVLREIIKKNSTRFKKGKFLG
jgi:hypothetical protein